MFVRHLWETSKWSLKLVFIYLLAMKPDFSQIIQSVHIAEPVMPFLPCAKLMFFCNDLFSDRANKLLWNSSLLWGLSCLLCLVIISSTHANSYRSWHFAGVSNFCFQGVMSRMKFKELLSSGGRSSPAFNGISMTVNQGEN